MSGSCDRPAGSQAFGSGANPKDDRPVTPAPTRGVTSPIIMSRRSRPARSGGNLGRCRRPGTRHRLLARRACPLVGAVQLPRGQASSGWADSYGSASSGTLASSRSSRQRGRIDVEQLPEAVRGPFMPGSGRGVRPCEDRSTTSALGREVDAYAINSGGRWLEGNTAARSGR